MKQHPYKMFFIIFLFIAQFGLPGSSAATAAEPAAGASRNAKGTATAPKQYPSFKQCESPQLDTALERFTEILQFHTVGNASHPEHADPVVWDLLDLWMHDTYRDVFSTLQVEKLGAGNLSYLMTWQGSQADLKPVLFVAHTDVVPVPDDTLKDWTYPPFDGVVADGFIWGRGTMDVKVLIVLLMEGISALLAEGYSPTRTLMFTFGHDEELMGTKGAALVAKELASRGVELEVIVDEGSSISMDGLAPIYSGPIAMVSTAEKEYVQIEVTLSSKGGHSSMPPVDGSSIGDRLGRFLAAMASRPAPVQVVWPTSDFLTAIGRLAPAGVSHLIAASSWLQPVRWLLGSLMTRAQPEAAAMVRSTAAVTRLQAGTADNVLPQTATVGINFRMLPGQTADTAVQLTRGWVGRDAAYANVSIVGDRSPHIRVADASGPHFAVLKAAIQQHWKLDVPNSQPLQVLPLLLPGVTDSRHYMDICPNGALRFTPWTARRADSDFTRLHGVDERLRVSDFACGLNTYKALLQGFGQFGVVKGKAAQGRTAGAADRGSGDHSEL